jgi:hypothetical protein
LNFRNVDKIIAAGIIVFILVTGCVTVNVNTPQTNPNQSAFFSRDVTPTKATPSPGSYGTLAIAGSPSSGITMDETDSSLAKTTMSSYRTKLNPDSKSDVQKRFQEVAFGNEAQYLNRWENRYVKLGIAGDYTPSDVETLKTFVLRFNNESDTTKLTMPYESENQEFTVRLVPSSFFKTLDENKTDKIIRNTETGEILFADQTINFTTTETDTIYINSRFTGEPRKYLILRGLLYDLGFEGYTEDTTSIFYYGANTTTLSRMDWAVIDLMYSKKFFYGESLSSVRSKLN